MTFYDDNIRRSPARVYNPRRKRRRPSVLSNLYAVLILLAVIFTLGACGTYQYLHAIKTQHVTFTVTGRNVPLANGGGHHKYLIYAKLDDGHYTTFQDTDNLWHLKFNSSDLYAQLQVGHRYRCRTAGSRVGFFSWYQNILSCQDLS